MTAVNLVALLIASGAFGYGRWRYAVGYRRGKREADVELSLLRAVQKRQLAEGMRRFEEPLP